MELYPMLQKMGLKTLIQEIERALINKAVENTKSYTEAAKLLRMKRSTLVYKRQLYGMPVQGLWEEKPFKSKFGGNE